MKIQYPVEKLEKGMYVAELDRPWEGTPFLFQGFVIEDDGDLVLLRECCKHVFVDDLKSDADKLLQDKLHAAVRGSAITNVEFHEWGGIEKLRETLQRAEVKTSAAVQSLTRFAESSVLEKGVSYREARVAIVNLIDEIAADPKTSQWIRILSKQDASISRHAVNTAALAIAFAADLGWDKELQSIVGEGAMIQDVGMARVPSQVRDKPGALTPLEHGLIKLHPAYAAKRLESSENLDPRILDIVRHHHERLDGGGYPDGLKEGEIAPYVQLVSICDVYEAYTTTKPYRKQLTSSLAMRRLTLSTGSHFNKDMVERFIRSIGIYPLGSLVRLKNNALAIVITSDEKRRLHPTILLVRDADGVARLPRHVLNLTFIETGMLPDKYGINDVLNPDDEHIDVRDILIQELQLRRRNEPAAAAPR